MQSSWKILKRYFHFATQQRWIYISAQVLQLLEALSSRAVPLIVGLIVDSVSKNNFGGAGQLLVLLVASRLLNTIFGLVRDELSDHIIMKSLWRNSRLEYIKALQNIDYSYHTNKSSGSLISLAKRGEAAIFDYYWQGNGEAVIILLEFLISLIVLSRISPLLAIITAFLIIFSLIVATFLINRNLFLRRRLNLIDDEITGVTVDNLIGFETVKIFAREDWELNRFQQIYKRWLKASFQYIHTYRWIDGISGLFTAVGVFIVFAVSLQLIPTGQLSIGGFVVAAVYISDIFNRSRDLAYKIRTLAKSSSDLQAYFEVMELKPAIKDKADAQDIREVTGAISFQNVSFGYDDQEVLKHINLNIKPDEKVALVGRSGAGKTTLTKLLLRFYDVQTGSINLDGIDLRDLKLQQLRKNIGLVPQDPVMFNDTIAYNISYGRPTATVAEVQHAAEEANLHQFIETLPMKYQTIVGERGIKLSGGQRQRLAIARVILANPEIIIFDEATSQLDSLNEQLIRKAFTNLTKQKTTIIIAHRLSTVMDADRIIVFQDGEIIEEGKHKELLEKSGVYQNLWKIQTEGLINLEKGAN